MLGSTLAQATLKVLTGATSSIGFQAGNIYMGLLTSEPVITVNASNIVTAVDFSTYEPVIGTSAYERELVGNYSIAFTKLFGDNVYYNSTSKYYYMSNVQQIKFNKAEGTWMANGTSTITHFGLFNTSTGTTGGAIIAWGALVSSIAVGANQAANIDVGDAELRIYAELSA